MPEPCVAVIDIGKTNLKLVAVDRTGAIHGVETARNAPVDTLPYRHVDQGHIWRWLLTALRTLAGRIDIAAIVPCAHGSTAALIDPGRDDDGLVLPILDYEADPPDDVKDGYARIAPPFGEVFSSTSPVSLTLGRQLFWQQSAFPDAFADARAMVHYPQYWAWRLTGEAATEVTSIGAQSHLWNPLSRDLSSLVDRQGWRPLFPPVRRAWEALGTIRRDVAEATGLPPDTPVLCGIHDSNANYVRYLAAGFRDFTLVSTGTWMISFNPAFPLDGLAEDRDTVANTDVEGRPVACSRFMGGREYEVIAGPNARGRADPHEIAALVADGTSALPSFSDSGGPFPGTGGAGTISGPEPSTPAGRDALGLVYAALMTSVAIDLIGSRNDIIIDGGFAESPLFCGLLASLRPGQSVKVSTARDGTAVGAAMLWGWTDRGAPAAIDLKAAPPLDLPELAAYAARWRHRAAGADPA